jgi:photosystem II stability/assembly factor-like uncharacterized protein
VGYISGDSGTILKTTDGGAIWEIRPSNTLANLYSIHFPSADTGYAVGQSPGIILKTTNGGSQWYIIPSDSSTMFYSVQFTDAETGYVAGCSESWGYATMMKTTNGGIDWSKQEFAVGWLNAFTSLSFPDKNTGYAVGWAGHVDETNAIIYKTTDAGESWAGQEWDGYSATSVHFPDIDTGFVIDFINVYKTTNGGSNLTGAVPPDFTCPVPLKSVYFTDTQTGYVVGESGAILKTANGGGLPVGIISIDSSQLAVGSWQLAVCVYPNPVFTRSEIRYQVGGQRLAVGGNVRITLHDITGKQIRILVDEVQAPGEQVVHFDASGFPAGMYFVRLQSGDRVETVKVVVMR